MGVPKFYRWLSERYPLINQLISGTVILPEFDNLYLDMNGIIHACTHPNDNHAANSLSLREMMLSIFRYIDRIVSEIVKPKKLLFLAIDGVAPRAKLNQQRARRFRAAQDRAESIQKAKQRGEVVDENSLFDSNCITPGTEFMELVHRHLKYFIRKKMKEDPIWAGLTIVYSGHDVPGEGEHKIMQYIRDLRASPTFEPNLRHCMYGQDADLIMLSLATHEPHFALLREVIQFNLPRHKKPVREVVYKQTQEAQFQLLHVSLLREYIALDFGNNMSTEMDHERIIDDFIFLTFLVGNDFLPHLPTLDISEHAFDVLINAYRSLWEANPGYLVDNGEMVDIERFENLCAIIGAQEQDILNKRALDKKEFQGKRASLEDLEAEEAKEAALQEAFEQALKEAMGTGDEATAIDVVPEEGWVVLPPAAKKPKKEDFFDADNVEDGEEEDLAMSERDHRGRYYYEKFKVVPSTSEAAAEFFKKLKYEYLQGLMWCLAYYSKGCISWTWYYPFHYGPMLQDMIGLTPIASSIRFQLGQPFTPYQQLLGCLPPLSSILLPRCYQFLMVNDDSPVKHFYPDQFEIDQDGKKNPWEAVVMLAFIDEKQLLEAERVHCPPTKLTPSEYNRNQFGKILQHTYDPNVTDTVLSCNPEIGLGDIHHCHSVLTEEEYSLLPGKAFVAKLVEGTEYPIAGYPSLTCVPLAFVDILAQKINVFGTESRYKSIILGLEVPNMENIDIKVMQKMLGKIVYVNYPHMHEAKVIGMSCETEEIRLVKDQIVHTKYDVVTQNKWKADSSKEEDAFLKGRSMVGTGGMFIDRIQIRVLCQVLTGMKRNSSTGESKKIYSTTAVDIPIQLVLWTSLVRDMRFVETSALSIEELYPIDVSVVATKGPLKGCVGKVIGPHSYNMTSFKQQLRSKSRVTKQAATVKKRVVDVEFQVPLPAPAFGYHIKNSIYDEYYSARDVCNVLHMTPNVLGKLVGNITIQGKSRERYDIGLNLKRNGVYQCNGYVRKVQPTSHKTTPKAQRNAWKQSEAIDIVGLIQDNNAVAVGESKEQVYWEYSNKSVMLIAEYQAKFPKLFQTLASLEHKAVYDLKDIFPGKKKEESVDLIMQWMKEQPFFHVPRTPLTSESLSREAMAAIERAADIYTTHAVTQGYQTLVVRSIALEHIFCNIHRTAQDLALEYNTLQPELGDRVVNLACSAVPLGLKGTVVAIHQEGKYVDVIFDEEFMGGKSLQGACSQFRGKLCSWSDLLLLQNNPNVHALNSAAEVSAEAKVSTVASYNKAVDVQIKVSEFSYDSIIDDYDEKIDELFALQDMTMILSKLQLGEKKSDGSGYKKLLEIAGVNNTIALSQNSQSKNSNQATSMLKSALFNQPGKSTQNQHKAPAVTQPVSFKSALIPNPSPAPAVKTAVAPAPAPSRDAANHHTPQHGNATSVVDKQAATRMVKHHLNVQEKRTNMPPQSQVVVNPAALNQEKSKQIMSILKKPVSTSSPAPAAVSALAPAPVPAPVPISSHASNTTTTISSNAAQKSDGEKLKSLLSKAKSQVEEKSMVATASKAPSSAPSSAPSFAPASSAASTSAPASSAAPAPKPVKNNLTSLLSKAKAGMKAKLEIEKQSDSVDPAAASTTSELTVEVVQNIGAIKEGTRVTHLLFNIEEKEPEEQPEPPRMENPSTAPQSFAHINIHSSRLALGDKKAEVAPALEESKPADIVSSAPATESPSSVPQSSATKKTTLFRPTHVSRKKKV